jgi:hypothetical protein
MGCLKWVNSVSGNKIHDTNQQLYDARTASILQAQYSSEVTEGEKSSRELRGKRSTKLQLFLNELQKRSDLPWS